MKLLILINGLSGKDIGGGDYHMLHVMKEWSKSHDISLVIPLLGFLFCRPFLLDKYKVYLTSPGTKAIESFQLIPAYFNRIMRSIFLHIDDRPDVIMCSSHMLFDTLPGFILHYRFRTKLVVYVHHIIGKHADHRRDILSRISILAEKLSLPLIRSASIVFVVNEEARSDLIEMGFDPAKIQVSSNGLDYNYIDTIRPTDDTRYEGCFCGRLVKRKGIYDLIKIWKLVTYRYPNSKLAIVGDGPEYTSLFNKLKGINLVENIKLMGFISDQDKFLIMKSSKVFIFPSYEEGWGIAVAEAIACGLNVVVYDIDTYRVFGKHVSMVEMGNTSKMAKIIIDLIEQGKNKSTEERKLVRIESVLDWQEVANKEIRDIGDVVQR
jgi:glycosyltransferase involved in cell wall biosynthesis